MSTTKTEVTDYEKQQLSRLTNLATLAEPKNGPTSGDINVSDSTQLVKSKFEKFANSIGSSAISAESSNEVLLNAIQNLPTQITLNEPIIEPGNFLEEIIGNNESLEEQIITQFILTSIPKIINYCQGLPNYLNMFSTVFKLNDVSNYYDVDTDDKILITNLSNQIHQQIVKLTDEINNKNNLATTSTDTTTGTTAPAEDTLKDLSDDIVNPIIESANEIIIKYVDIPFTSHYYYDSLLKTTTDAKFNFNIFKVNIPEDDVLGVDADGAPVTAASTAGTGTGRREGGYKKKRNYKRTLKAKKHKSKSRTLRLYK